MYEILMIVYLVVALALVGFILIQQGKGAGMGSSFGSGASGTVFGASGSGNFLTKTTTVLAIVFFGVALGLGNLTSDKSSDTTGNSLFADDNIEQTPVTEIPDSTSSDLPVDEIPAIDNSGDLPVDTATENVGATDEETETDPKPKEDGGNN